MASSISDKDESASDKRIITATKTGFLHLSAELRNNIYRRSLVCSQSIVIDLLYHTPALLQASAQIRQEASSIYHLDNKFDLIFPAFSCRPAQHFAFETGARTFWSTMIKSGSVTSGYSGITYNWENLLAWLKDFYDRKMWKYVATPGYHADVKAAHRAFEIVEKMREKLDWEDVLEILVDYKAAMEDVGVWGYRRLGRV